MSLLQFEYGDIIEWCDEYFMVIADNGLKGRVNKFEGYDEEGNILVNSEELKDFYWNHNGNKAKLVTKYNFVGIIHI